MERISVYLCQHYAWAPIAHVESMLVQHFGLLYLKVKMALHFSAMRMHTEIIVRYRFLCSGDNDIIKSIVSYHDLYDSFHTTTDFI